MIRSQIRSYRTIRFCALVTFLCGLTMVAVSVPPRSYAPAPLGLVPVAAGILGLAALVIAAGLWWFSGWARRAGIFLTALVTIVTLVMLYLSATDPYSTRSLICFELIMLILWSTNLAVLLGKPSRTIFQGTGRGSAPRRR
jgi:hypothetical protein